MQRKNVLYNLIKPQKNMVEHIMSTVIRSDGTRIDGDEYFPGKGKKEFGRTPMEFDSIQLAMLDSDLVRYDKQRMRGKSHESIELDRALVLEELYSSIVVKLGQEGLMFKDLASPYYLGKAVEHRRAPMISYPDASNRYQVPKHGLLAEAETRLRRKWTGFRH